MKRHSPIGTEPRSGTVATADTAVATAEAPSGAATPSPQPKAAEPSRGSALKKVSFGNIAKKKEDTKTSYPILPEIRDSSELAARILQRTADLEALEGALETDKAELKMLATPFYFQVNHGRHDVPSSIAVPAKDESGHVTGEVLVTFQNRYSLLPDESAVQSILGELTDKFFRQCFELKIAGDKLPADKVQELMDELQTLFARYNATDAIEVKEGVKPVKEFHDARHLELSVEDNMALDEACPIIKVVKTKGRKK